MGLVDYDSDSASSDGEATAAKATTATTSTTTTTGKKPFQKLVDRANPGKIVVSLPSSTASADTDAIDDDADDRPAKRAKIGAAGVGTSRFSGFGSFLPPPKKTGAAAATSGAASAGPSTPTTTTDLAAHGSRGEGDGARASTRAREGVSLKTSGEAAFRRPHDGGDNNGGGGGGGGLSSTLSLPPPKGPSIPAGMQAAEDVKLVGNPLAFMPLSVSRKQPKKKKANGGGGGVAVGSAAGSTKAASTTTAANAAPEPAEPAEPAAPPAKKKISLFSLTPDDQAEVERAGAVEEEGADLAVFQDEYGTVNAYGYGYEQEQQQEQQLFEQQQQQPHHPPATSLDAIADDLQLSARERRELFGRQGAAGAAAGGKTAVATAFNLDQEYRHNNDLLRQASELQQQQQQQSHNPVRALMPGKHSLRQLVNAVHTQRDALEETFAKNRAAQRDAGGKYGWKR
ncbi:stress activated map kinase interacting [Niveomyces insectorum RCEF 264]|uniref:Stress activated map kinase interacting n=1 Tax=Niveomyces insectorum RCEF 264 TaxID=1081102 RepID=A0A167RIS7_9HYPO|nr:stress activated map kinase interacting [Niveomyces insectorum RCEF 264]